jgi:hypothetical protein
MSGFAYSILSNPTGAERSALAETPAQIHGSYTSVIEAGFDTFWSQTVGQLSDAYSSGEAIAGLTAMYTDFDRKEGDWATSYAHPADACFPSRRCPPCTRWRSTATTPTSTYCAG